MNRYFFCLLAAASLLMNCQENKEDQNTPISEKDTYKLIGEEIPFETGMEWIGEYRKRGPSEGRTELLSPYHVSDSQLETMLASMENLVGVAFHYGIDEGGQKHIILVPIDESLSIWSDVPGKMMIDANTGQQISPEVAQAWAVNFTDTHPNSIWFHFFGANIFEDICALPFFDSVAIEPAINILTLKPQLLLVIYNNGLLDIGRAESAAPGAVYDASNACPPCAVR